MHERVIFRCHGTTEEARLISVPLEGSFVTAILASASCKRRSPYWQCRKSICWEDEKMPRGSGRARPSVAGRCSVIGKKLPPVPPNALCWWCRRTFAVLQEYHLGRTQLHPWGHSRAGGQRCNERKMADCMHSRCPVTTRNGQSAAGTRGTRLWATVTRWWVHRVVHPALQQLSLGYMQESPRLETAQEVCAVSVQFSTLCCLWWKGGRNLWLLDLMQK